MTTFSGSYLCRAFLRFCFCLFQVCLAISPRSTSQSHHRCDRTEGSSPQSSQMLLSTITTVLVLSSAAGDSNPIAMTRECQEIPPSLVPQGPAASYSHTYGLIFIVMRVLVGG
eukprot:222959_1